MTYNKTPSNEPLRQKRSPFLSPPSLPRRRLDGGTLTQVLGYDTRIRDRRRRFWKRRQMPYVEVLAHSHALASAVHYLHSSASPGSVIMHRDLKPDNVGFTLAGELKLIDFGLAKVIENADAEANDVYRMSGETGSLRYMAPEVRIPRGGERRGGGSRRAKRRCCR